MTDESKAQSSGSKAKKERKPRTKGGKTQEQKRAAWKAYYDDNKAKYRAWARGWRSGIQADLPGVQQEVGGAVALCQNGFVSDLGIASPEPF